LRFEVLTAVVLKI